MAMERLEIEEAEPGYYLVRSESITVYAVHVAVPAPDPRWAVQVYRRPAPEAAGRVWPSDFRWTPINKLVAHRLDPDGEVESAPGEFRVGWRPRIWDFYANWVIARETTSIEKVYEASLLALDISPR